MHPPVGPPLPRTVAAEHRIQLPSDATSRRALEFRIGRDLALSALLQLPVRGAVDAPEIRHVRIDRGPLGEPVFPAGVTGSITHTDGLVAVEVGARMDGLRAIGIDAVPVQAAMPGLEAFVGDTGELRDAVRAVGESLAPLAVLSAKESVFKACYPLTGAWLEFDDIRVALHSGGFFGVRLRTMRRGVGRWRGSWWVDAGFLRTRLLILERRMAP